MIFVFLCVGVDFSAVVCYKVGTLGVVSYALQPESGIGSTFERSVSLGSHKSEIS